MRPVPEVVAALTASVMPARDETVASGTRGAGAPAGADFLAPAAFRPPAFAPRAGFAAAAFAAVTALAAVATGCLCPHSSQYPSAA